MANEIKTISPKSRQQWKEWLEKNHDREQTVWVICAKKNADKPAVTYEDAVLEALCYGWIDAKAQSLDEGRYLQSFNKRNPKSVWSKINKEKVKKLIDAGLMTQAGFESIEVAKSNGYWSIMDAVEALIVPKDLEKEFRKRPDAKARFLSLSRSEKKVILQSLVLAQRPETRQKRIADFVASLTV